VEELRGGDAACMCWVDYSTEPCCYRMRRLPQVVSLPDFIQFDLTCGNVPLGPASSYLLGFAAFGYCLCRSSLLTGLIGMAGGVLLSGRIRYPFPLFVATLSYRSEYGHRARLLRAGRSKVPGRRWLPGDFFWRRLSGHVCYCYLLPAGVLATGNGLPNQPRSVARRSWFLLVSPRRKPPRLVTESSLV
jgi:hypothetical protein